MSLGDYFANVPFQTSFHFYSLTNQVVKPCVDTLQNDRFLKLLSTYTAQQGRTMCLFLSPITCSIYKVR